MIETIITALIVALLAFASGFLLSHIRNQKKLVELQRHSDRLETELAGERRITEEKLRSMEESREKLSESFSALSSQALKNNNESFLQLAKSSLEQFHTQAQGDLEKKEKAVEHLIKPIKEALEKTEEQMRRIEHERKESYGALTKHLESMSVTQQLLHDKTSNLVQALRRPEVRGQWGELTLKRLAELAGMVEHCDFYEQENVNTEEGRLRPDMIVRMPGGREIVVDVKTPLDAYLNAIECNDESSKQLELVRHARQVRERVKELATKSYWQQFKNSPDFVVLFIPGDQFLSAALDVDRKLLEDALSQKVILSTPTSLVALLRAVAYGWRQEALTDNAETIRVVGEELYSRLTTFAEHLGKLGKSLDGSVGHFNKAVGSFDTRILPSARRFGELGIAGKKELEPAQQIEKSPRRVESSEEEKTD